MMRAVETRQGRVQGWEGGCCGRWHAVNWKVRVALSGGRRGQADTWGKRSLCREQCVWGLGGRQRSEQQKWELVVDPTRQWAMEVRALWSDLCFPRLARQSLPVLFILNQKLRGSVAGSPGNPGGEPHRWPQTLCLPRTPEQ